MGKGGKLVRHGGDDAVNVLRFGEAAPEFVKRIRRYVHRHDHGVAAALYQRLRDARRRFDLGYRVANDGDDASGAAERKAYAAVYSAAHGRRARLRKCAAVVVGKPKNSR